MPPPPQRRASDAPLASRVLDAAHTIWGGVFALVLVGLLALLIAERGRYFQAPEWVGFYVGIALVAGIVFWVITPGGSGEIEIKHLGAKLGGGAAVGAIFMLLAKQITPSADLTIVTLPPTLATAGEVNYRETSPGLELHELSPQQLLVRFDERVEEGTVRADFFHPRTLAPQAVCFRVQRGADRPTTETC